MTLSKDRYDEEVQTQAEYLIGAVVEFPEDGDNPLEAVIDVLDGHGWFGHNKDAAFHGAILDHGEADPGQYRDIDGYIEGRSADQIVETLAFAQFEADVVETALAEEPEVFDR